MEEKNKLIIPIAIVIAGVIVAVAIFYSSGSPKPDAPHEPTTAAGALPEITSADFVLGDSKAPVTIIEYGDYQCPFCGRFFHETEAVVRDQYIAKSKVKFVYRDFAFLGQESTWAGEAAHCAADQGKFWEMHDYLYNHQNGENQGAFSKDNLKKFAVFLGLDQTKFNSCLDSDKYATAVRDLTLGGQKSGVNGTPANFINGALNVGALATSQFVQLIEQALTKAGK